MYSSDKINTAPKCGKGEYIMDNMNKKIATTVLMVILVLGFLPSIPVAGNTGNPERPGINQLSYPIAVVGSDNADDIVSLLVNDGGYSSSDVVHFNKWSDLLSSLSSGDLYSLVIINDWGEDPGSGDKVVQLLKALDLRDIPVFILDTGYVDNGGGEIINSYANDVASAGYPAPVDYVQHYPSPSNVLIDIIDNAHPIFNGVSSDPYQVATSSSSYCDYALYHSFTGPSVTRLAWLNDTYNDEAGYGIAEWVAPGGEHWIFNSEGGVSSWMKYTTSGSDGQYSDNHKTVFLNTVSYLISTGNPHQPPKGRVYGHVYDLDTNEPIPNATVCAGLVCNTTDSNGYYVLKLEEGTYNITASSITHRPSTAEVSVTAGSDVQQDFYLQKKPKADVFVAIIGDYADDQGYGKDLYSFLSWNYSAAYYTSLNDFEIHRNDYNWSVVILQWLGYSEPDINDFIGLLRWLDANNIPVIILDTWYSGYPAGYYMYRHSSEIGAAGYPAPTARSETYDSTSSVDVVVVNATHPIFRNVPSTYKITDYSDSYYAYYTGFTEKVRILANISYSGSNKGVAIAEWKAPQNESWIFISYGTNIKHHYNVSDSYGYFTPEAKKVLENAIDYAASTKHPPIFIRLHGHVYNTSGSPIEGARVAVEGGSENTTDASGYYVLKVPADSVLEIMASHIGYYINKTTLHTGYSDIEYDIILKSKPPSIVIVGDHETSSGKLDLNLTLSQWWTIEEASDYKELWDIIDYEGNVKAVIINSWMPGYDTPPADDIVYTLQLLDNNSIPTIFLGGYGGGYYGIYPLYYESSSVESAGYPAPDSSDYWFPDAKYVWVNMTSPDAVFFKNIAPDADNAFHVAVDPDAELAYRGYNFTDDSVKYYAVFSDMYHSYNNIWMDIVGWNTSSGVRWVFLIGASTDYVRYSETGDYNRWNLKMILLLNNTINYVLEMTPPTLTGKLVGHVYDENGHPLANATVEITELGLSNKTDVNGYYVINNIPAGTYTVKVSLFGYYTSKSTISLGAGLNTYDVVLHEAPPAVVIVGDDNGDILNSLSSKDIYAYDAEDYHELINILCTRPDKVGVVVFNSWGETPTADDVVYVLRLLDSFNIPVVFLDSWGSYYYHGGYYLAEYSDSVSAAGYPAPVYREDYWAYNVSISMNASSPVFSGITPDYDNAFYIGADTTSYTDYAYYEFTSDVTILGYLLVDGSPVGASVAEWTAPGGEKWIFLSSAASYKWMKYSEPGGDNQYSDKALQLLVNAITYANSTRGPTPSHIIIDVTVKDAVTLDALKDAVITVIELGEAYNTNINGSAELDLPVTCGNYTLLINKSGYVNVTLSVYGFANASITILLNEYGNGTITGHVYDAETGLPIEGARIEVPGINYTYTGPDGSYSLKIPAGRWSLKVSKPLYVEYTTTVAVQAGSTISLDIYLHPSPPIIAVVGDYEHGTGEYDITDYLNSLGYNAVRFSDWEDLYLNLSNYRISLVILDRIGSPSVENLTNLLKALDARNIPIIILDTWGSSSAGYYMYEYMDNLTALGYPAPVYREEHYPSDVYVNATFPEHPIFNGVSFDTGSIYRIYSDSPYWVDYAGYVFHPMRNLSILANISSSYGSLESIAVWIAPGGERWVFLSYGGSRWGGYLYPGDDFDFSDAAKQVFVNIILYANNTHGLINGTITLKVYDARTGLPVSSAAVSVPGLGLTVYTDSAGLALLSLPPGPWTIMINKSGYFNKTIHISSVEYANTSLIEYMAPYAYITGYILDAETNAPIANATITITSLSGRIIVHSGLDGEYSAVVPALPSTISVEHPLYHAKTITGVVFAPREVKVLNITVTRIHNMVILIGDEDDHDLLQFLETSGFYVEYYDNLSAALDRINTGVDVGVVIFNQFDSSPSLTDLLGFIHVLDERNISLVILDTWSYSYSGGYVMYEYKDDLLSNGYPAPSTRSVGYTGSVEYIKYEVKIPLYPFTYDLDYNEAPVASPDSGEVDYAYYTFPSNVLVDNVAVLKDGDTVLGTAIAVWYAPGGEKWIYMSAWSNIWDHYSTTSYYGHFSSEAKDLLVRAINYALIHKPKIDVLNLTITHKKLMFAGDVIHVSGVAYERIGNERIPYANKTLTIYALSTPTPIANVTTGPDGSFNQSFTIPANVPGGYHRLGIGDPSGNYEPAIVTPPGPEGRVMLLPAPETPLLPLLLLAAVILLILYKRRK